MNNTEIINDIVVGMMSELDGDQLGKLKMVLQMKLANVQIVPISTEVAILDEDINDTLIKKWVVELKVNNYSDKSIYNYVNATQNFFNVVNKTYSDITKDDVLLYIVHLKNKHLSDNTVDNLRKYIKQFFKWLVMNDYIIQSPFDKLQKCTKRKAVEKVVMDELELEMVRDTYEDLRDKALFDVLEATGVRVSELVNMKVNDVDFMRGSIKVYATKTNKYRTVYLTPRALKHLVEYRNDLCKREIYSDYLFLNTKKTNNEYKPMSRQSVNDRIHAMTGSANINKHITVHTFRKTLATKLVRKGVKPTSVQSILGHSSYNTTVKFYSSISDEDVENEYRKAVL